MAENTNTEREAFEAWYCDQMRAAGYNADEGIAYLREGNHYGKDRVMLNGKWEGWQARASLSLPAAGQEPVAWQERQQTSTGWTPWYDARLPTCMGKGPGLSELLGGIEYQWRPLYAAPQPPEPYSIDADPQGIRATVADAITGALAFGAQGVNQPPEGHWLAPFWNAARADKAAPQPAVAAGWPLIARALDEWQEDDGPVMWWAWNGHASGWAGEPAWCGTPLSSDWPGYHTHWTPHPTLPLAPSTEGERNG